jgi:hypothetical protein
MIIQPTVNSILAGAKKKVEYGSGNMPASQSGAFSELRKIKQVDKSPP